MSECPERDISVSSAAVVDMNRKRKRKDKGNGGMLMDIECARGIKSSERKKRGKCSGLSLL